MTDTAPRAKLIFLLIDGLRLDVAQVALGYLGHLVEVGQASFHPVQAELPSVSRPVYEVLMTGTPSSVNGITSNQVIRPSHQTSLFHLVRQQGAPPPPPPTTFLANSITRPPSSPCTTGNSMTWINRFSTVGSIGMTAILILTCLPMPPPCSGIITRIFC